MTNKDANQYKVENDSCYRAQDNEMALWWARINFHHRGHGDAQRWV